MALVKNTLESALKIVFLAMQDGYKTDAWMAAQVADAIKTYILTGQVSTTDTGAAPAGVYAGAGMGSMTIDADSFGDALKSTFEAQYDNDALSTHMASDIDEDCKLDDTVSTTSTGTVTTPVGATSPFSGPGQGKFTSAKVAIETMLTTCFASMNNMSANGDDYFASQLALAVDSYLKAGSISVSLKAPFASGSGSGKIS